MKLFGKELKFNNNKVYHAGDKPTPEEIGAAASVHNHDGSYIKLNSANNKLKANQWWFTNEQSSGGGTYGSCCFDMMNSDIVGLSALVFCDSTDSMGEGLFFAKSSDSNQRSKDVNDYDRLYIKNGYAFINDTSLSSDYLMYDALNNDHYNLGVRDGLIKLNNKLGIVFSYVRATPDANGNVYGKFSLFNEVGSLIKYGFNATSNCCLGFDTWGYSCATFNNTTKEISIAASDCRPNTPVVIVVQILVLLTEASMLDNRTFISIKSDKEREIEYLPMENKNNLNDRIKELEARIKELESK